MFLHDISLNYVSIMCLNLMYVTTLGQQQRLLGERGLPWSHLLSVGLLPPKEQLCRSTTSKCLNYLLKAHAFRGFPP